MEKILLISPASIKKDSVIETNFPDKVLSVQIWETQDIDLKEILGKDKLQSLYDNIQAKNDNPSYVYPDDIENLLSKVRPFITYSVLVNVLVPISYQYTPKGLANKNDTSANMATGGDLQFVRNFYSQRLAHYRKQLEDHCSCSGLSKDLSRSTGWYLNSDRSAKEWIEATENKLTHTYNNY